jgi:hypothetical protein
MNFLCNQADRRTVLCSIEPDKAFDFDPCAHDDAQHIWCAAEHLPVACFPETRVLAFESK